MNNNYIYKFNYTVVNEQEIEATISCTVIFCYQSRIFSEDISKEIKEFYQSNYQTDQIVVIGGEYLKQQMIDIFIDHQDDTFIGIPRRNEIFLNENLFLLTYDEFGKLDLFHNCELSETFYKKFRHEGSQNIFIKRGGLIVTHGTHHFVFPSGKHCDKFLRTGNILLNGSEISFLAFCLLEHLKPNFDRIFCDTSSINSVAYALLDLKRKFNPNYDYPIESFGSYDGLYKNPKSYTPKDFLIISASTSANIISYILLHHEMIDRENIAVLYFLGKQKDYLTVKDKVICNLTKSDNNLEGIEYYPTYQEKDCLFCRSGSYPVQVSGDVFLLEKPHINRIVLSVRDPQNNLSSFVQQFKSIKTEQSILKTNYKENSKNKYEVYVSYDEIIQDVIDNRARFSQYQRKLDNFINQYIPSNTKYIVHLDDSGSRKLAEYITSSISKNYKDDKVPVNTSILDLSPIKNQDGSLIVVGSCISNGKNLLYLSRALRKFNNLRLIYFVGLVRTPSLEHLNFLKSNLCQGMYGATTNSFVSVEILHCNGESKNNSWQEEIDFISELITHLNNTGDRSEELLSYLTDRKNYLKSSSSEISKGLSNKLFYPQIIKDKHKELKIRKGFAFFKFTGFTNDVAQSDIYFTISNIVNSLRFTEDKSKNLIQSTYVRNLIDPGNFNRFNDGIIQASILRSASPEEMFYSMDSNLSEDMYSILETIVKYRNNDQGEALLEFMYALAIRKLTLKEIHLEKLLDIIDSNCDVLLVRAFSEYIRKVIIDKETID